MCKLLVRAGSSIYMFHCDVRLCGAITLNKRIFWSKEVPCAKRVSSCMCSDKRYFHGPYDNHPHAHCWNHYWFYVQIFDKLCQSFGGDVLQVLLNAAVTVGECPLDKLIKAWLQFCLDQSIAVFAFYILNHKVCCFRWLVARLHLGWHPMILIWSRNSTLQLLYIQCFGLLTLTFWCSLMHSLVIMSQAITISAAINSQNNMLLTLLISNNFAEIKSNVFKRVGKDNLHKMAYHGMISSILVSADVARSTKPKGHRNQTLCPVGFIVKSECLMFGALCVCLTLCYYHFCPYTAITLILIDLLC
jgi:hypothetical protein